MPTNDFLPALLALGVLAACVPTGLHVLRAAGGKDEAQPSTDWALAFPVGIAVWSVPLVAAAWAGVFSPTVLGIFGWVVTVAGVSLLSVKNHRRRWSWREKAALVALIGLAWLYAGFANESLLGERDEGLYSLMAMRLLRTGSLAVDIPAAASLAPALFQPFTDGPPPAFYLPGIYQTGIGLQLQFPPVLPAWIAQAAAATGGAGLFRANALFSLASVLVFHALARRFLRPTVALLATAIFALNPAQVWISRVNLVEPLARLLVLGGLLAAVLALEHRSKKLAFVAAGLFAAAAFGRLDLLLLAPLAVGATAVMHVWPSTRFDPARPTLAALAAATVAAQTAAVSLLAITSPEYLHVNAGTAWTAAGATLCALVLLAACRSRAALQFGSENSRRALALVLVASTVLLLVYAAWIRPHIEPFALIDRAGHALHGTRDYRERSLPNLAAYLSWPVVLAAAAGTAIALARIWLGRASAALMLAVLALVPPALVLLANPRISPDHFWAVRRFVPLVIPGFILIAGYGIQALLVRFGRNRQETIARVLTASAVGFFVLVQWPTLLARENHGLAGQLSTIAASLGDTSLVVARDLDALATTLLVGFGRPVLPLRDAAAEVNASSRRFWSHCTPEKPCALVHADASGLAGLTLGASRRVGVERRYFEQTPLPLPRAVRSDVSTFLITSVVGLADGSANRLGGAFLDWTIDEKGFHREDLLASSSGRWTDGDAMIRLPRVDADTLELQFVVPGHTARRVKITLDGSVLHEGPLAGQQRLTFPLRATDQRGTARELHLSSDPFNPKAAGVSADSRTLGVWVAAIRQYDSRVARLHRASERPALRSRVTPLVDPAAAPLVIDARSQVPRCTMMVANEGNEVWPGGDDVQAGEVPVALGIVWRRRGDGVVVHEHRVGLPFALRPGERIMMSPEIDPRRHGGQKLPPGEYELEFDLVLEGVTWFSQRGGVAARVTAAVGSDSGNGR